MDIQKPQHIQIDKEWLKAFIEEHFGITALQQKVWYLFNERDIAILRCHETMINRITSLEQKLEKFADVDVENAKIFEFLNERVNRLCDNQAPTQDQRNKEILSEFVVARVNDNSNKLDALSESHDTLNAHACLNKQRLDEVTQKFEQFIIENNKQNQVIHNHIQHEDGQLWMIVTENSDKITLLKEETKFLDQWCDKNSIRLDAVEKRQEDDNKVFEFLTERLNRASERYSELYESIVKIQEMKDSGIKEIAQAIRDLSKPSECDVSQEWFSHEQMEIIRKHIWTNHNNDWNSIRGISPRQLKEILIKIQEIQSC